MLIGPNASGKTGALKALSFLSWFIRNSFMGLNGEADLIPVDTYAFSEKKDIVSEFELLFEHNGSTYKYIIHMLPTHVVLEELHQKKESGHFNYLFVRKWDPEKKEYDITQRIGLNSEVIKSILRKNVSMISAGVAIKNEFLTGLSVYWEKVISNVSRIGKSWDTASLGDVGMFAASETYFKDAELLKKITMFLKDIDLGLDEVRIEASEGRDEKMGKGVKNYHSFGVHSVAGREYKLPFALESSGTKNMYVLLGFLLPVITKGGIAVIDELELDLHPHALPKIVDLFINPETNPNNSQLIFTTHSMEIMNYLEKEQIILVEKDKGCESSLYRLDSLKGVRRDDNLYAKYMSGAYGAVPDI